MHTVCASIDIESKRCICVHLGHDHQMQLELQRELCVRALLKANCQATLMIDER